VGSGKGKNMALGKIQDKLFIATTEAIYELRGDQLSAIAETFSIDMVEEKRLVAGRTWVKVENSLIGLYDDLEMWSFNGMQSKMLSYKECSKKSINPYREYLNKAVATYEDNYYKLSVVETGKTECNLEFWYDTLEDKIEFIRDRNVSCYLQSDPTIELPFKLIGKSDINHISTADYGYNFDGQPIVYQFKTKSYSPRPGDNVRFDEFVPKITAKGIKQILFRYLLDTRISDLDDIAKFWEQLDGEVKFLGLIRIVNQQVFTDNIKPKIKYSKGESISFEIYGRETDLVFGMQGIGVSYTKKGSKMGKKVGQ
jgi:hypothetical protein